MATNPSHSNDPKKQTRDNQPQITSTEHIQAFWFKNEKNIYIACFAAILLVAAVGIYRNIRQAGDAQVGLDYTAATTTEQLRAFASSNPGHPLASAAEIRIADEAYTAKNYAAAALAYDKASDNKSTPFAGRALVGAAMSRILAGQTADGEARLAQISADATQSPVIRGEAAYHLATLAATAGRTADASALYNQVTAIAPGTIWADNAAYQASRLAIVTNTTVTAQPDAPPPAGVPAVGVPVPSLEVPAVAPGAKPVPTLDNITPAPEQHPIPEVPAIGNPQ